jgi:hypothetical protein
MRIKKSELNRIIKEELDVALQNVGFGAPSDGRLDVDKYIPFGPPVNPAQKKKERLEARRAVVFATYKTHALLRKFGYAEKMLDEIYIDGKFDQSGTSWMVSQAMAKKNSLSPGELIDLSLAMKEKSIEAQRAVGRYLIIKHILKRHKEETQPTFEA